MALQLHRIQFTKSTFVNEDINLSPEPLPATSKGMKVTFFTKKEGVKRKKNEKEGKSERDRKLHDHLAEQKQMTINKVIIR